MPAAPPPQTPLRILLVGDSIMAGIGPQIRKDIAAQLGGSVDVRARVATGLARTDIFDWQEHLTKTLVGQRYDIIMMMLGTNDSQDFVEEGHIYAYGSPAWIRVYNQRLANIMSAACQGAPQVLWLGLPPMQSPAFDRKMQLMNQWAAARAAERQGCLSYVSLTSVLGDARGRFSSYLRFNGSLEKMRSVDGIHVTGRGGRLVAAHVIELIRGRAPLLRAARLENAAVSR